MSEGGNALRGFVFFLAWFMGGLAILYGMSPLISTQPFVQKFFQNSPWTYFDFVGFWFWFIITPLTFWWYVVRAASTPRRVFH